MILYLGNMLSKHGNSVSVIETLAPRLSENIPIKAYSSKKNQLFRLLDMLLAILRYRREIKVVLIDSYSSPRAFTYTLAVALLCRYLNISYIPILHGGDFPNRIQRWDSLCQFVFSNSIINISPSNYLRDAFEHKGFKTALIPNAVEVDKYNFKLRKIIRPRLLWVRAFHQSTYNPQMAIKALQLLTEYAPNACLCMVGPDKDGSLKSCQTMANELGISDKITFTGRLSKAEWTSLSSGYDIFISTTNFDNMPVSVIEAMALGLPVVSTNVGGVPYLIEHEKTGLLVPPNDVEEMVRAITKLISNNALAESLSLAARQKAEQYDWRNIKPQWIEILNGVS